MMKKEIAACAILLFLLFMVFLNLHTLGRLTENIEQRVSEVQALSAAGKWAPAAEKCAELTKAWQGLNRYTHVFIRHSDIEKLDDALSNYHSALLAQDLPLANNYSQLLIERLRAVYAMEKIRLGSIL